MYICDKCENGWIRVGENMFNICNCPSGRQLQGFTALIDFANEKSKIDQAMEWYRRKLGW